ncbi:LCP family protein [Corynebacterium pacaense]|uniref:LCP family protein n=1 Tax=Corynebacterium pacaense TaxID=1816684 RepID=UPI0015C46F8D|nr:LCP family protein [Corynebacterium pacaense]
MDQRGHGDYARDSHGRPIVDRYGRPVRARRQQPRQQPPRHEQPRQQPPRHEQPRQQPPRQVPPPINETRIYNPPAGHQAGHHTRPPAQHPAHQPSQIGRVPAAQPGVRRQPAPRPHRRPGGCLRWLGLILAAVLVLSLAGALWADSRLNRVDATPATRVSNTAGTNWLLVGSDSREGLSQEDIDRLGTGGDIGLGRTDTIMVLHIPRSGEPTLLSIPRDSYINIPGYGMDKANAAFTVGGPQLLTQTVEEATGLRIDHYAEIGMGGLANMVDAVGGVQLCPAEPIDDPLANLNVQAGCQEFDGATALGYVRTRATAMGDLDRVVRQREFFAALLGTVTSPATLLNPFRMFPLLGDAVGTFTVGNGDHIWHLARLALAMRGGMITETIPIAGFADYDVGSVVLWDDAASEQLFTSLR